MKNIALFLFLFLASFWNLNAQSSASKKISFAHLQLPTHPIANKALNTYSIAIEDANEGTNAALNLSNQDVQKKHLQLSGFTFLLQQADIQISLQIGAFEMVQLVAKSKIVAPKGSSQAPFEVFYYEMVYSLPLTLQMLEQKSARRINQWKSVSKQRFTFGETDPKESNKAKEKEWLGFRTKEDLEKAWKIYENETIKQQTKQRYNLFLSQITSTINRMYGYNSKHSQVVLTGFSKNTDHTEKVKEMLEIADCVFSTMRADYPIAAIEKKIKPIIDFFDEIKENFSVENRSDKKTKQACLYNIAALYYCLDDFENAKKYNALSVALNKNEAYTGRNSSLKKWIENAEKMLTVNQCYTRHYPLGNGFEPVRETRLKQDGSTIAEAGVFSGKIELNNNEIKEGWLFYDASDKKSSNKGLLFSSEKQSLHQLYEQSELFCPTEVKAFDMAGKRFEVQNLGKNKHLFIEKM